MSNPKLQCKYLDAGAKSSPVVIDPSLSTGNDQTVYLYHHQRDRIIEYRRDIVETKLRDLSEDEAKQETALLSDYQKVREGFMPKGKVEPEPVQAPTKRTEVLPTQDEIEGDFDDEVILDDEMDDM